jgi:hypothetical protein
MFQSQVVNDVILERDNSEMAGQKVAKLVITVLDTFYDHSFVSSISLFQGRSLQVITYHDRTPTHERF